VGGGRRPLRARIIGERLLRTNELKVSDLECDGDYFMCSESSEEEDLELQLDIPRRKMKMS
jgi:hypothetical protein